MLHLSTEFPVKYNMGQSIFVKHIINWLNGTRYSTLFKSNVKFDLHDDLSFLKADNGEELQVRSLSLEGIWQATGFRYDFPDNEGRHWRTEAVLKKGNNNEDDSIFRLRIQCIAKETGARLDIPHKPFLIKSILKSNFGGNDKSFYILDQPYWLQDDQKSLDLAQKITNGESSYYLPVVYISAVGHSRWIISENQIKKLSYELGGIAHVVAEPSRAFSFRLRDLCLGKNVYGGNIGIFIPDQGFTGHVFFNNPSAEREKIVSNLSKIAKKVCSQMPAKGWDWTELQENILQIHRIHERKRLNQEDIVSLYDAEISNLKEKIQQLKDDLALSQKSQASIENIKGVNGNQFIYFLETQIGPEIYPGEFMDRIRDAAKTKIDRADQDGLDSRSKAIFYKFSSLPISTGLIELREDLKRATKAAGSISTQIENLLIRHGYQSKSHNKHIRLEAKPGFDGLGSITIPTTPSDSRGLANLRSDIEKALGLNKIKY